MAGKYTKAQLQHMARSTLKALDRKDKRGYVIIVRVAAAAGMTSEQTLTQIRKLAT